MVDQAEFERVRSLVAEALEEAFADRAMKPWERVPGHWYFWPARNSDLRIEPIGIWQYGKRVGEDLDRLQAVIRYPYSQSERVRPRSADAAFGKKEAVRAAKLAKEISDSLAAQHGDDEQPVQEAYKLGYLVVTTAEEDDKELLWQEREAVYRNYMANWDRLWNAVRAILRMRTINKGPFDWSPEGLEEREGPDPWLPLVGLVGEDKIRDMAYRGALHAIDDWAFEKGLLVEEPWEGNLVLAR